MKTGDIRKCIDNTRQGSVHPFREETAFGAGIELQDIETEHAALIEALDTILGDAHALYDVTALDGLMDIIGVCQSTKDNCQLDEGQERPAS